MSQTPAELWTVWRRTAVKDDGLLLFYGHGDRADDPWFSNFYEHSPFAFAIPPWCGVYGGRETVPIEFSEKAIMLCKASLMGDEKTFARVAAAQTPAEANGWGGSSSRGTRTDGRCTSVTLRGTSRSPSLQACRVSGSGCSRQESD